MCWRRMRKGADEELRKVDRGIWTVSERLLVTDSVLLDVHLLTLFMRYRNRSDCT